MACVFYYIGVYDDQNPDNWVTNFNMEQYSIFEIYITSMYFSLTTMAGVGYGDITPISNFEKVYCMGCMIITTGLSAYLIGSLNTIFNRSSILTKDMKMKSFHINQFLLNREIPVDLK